MKHSTKHIGRSMLKFQEELARQYHYKEIKPNLFIGDVRDIYYHALSNWCALDGAQTALESTDGTVLCSGYRRIVIGDYGAFIEITPE